jgi:SAM-dependent methyltransferase
MTSRFILQKDPSSPTVADINLPSAWWSRPHEYCWAAQFAGQNLIVLDAACGISHPFKWHLGNTCLSTWACDNDWRIGHKEQILEDSKELGNEGYSTVAQYLNRTNVHLIHSSITALPSSMPHFDRIFCISTLEHLSPNDRQLALNEFSRMLMPNGLVILTMDYPQCSPEEILKMADAAGLRPAGSFTIDPPPEGALFNSAWGLHVYRCVLKRK